MSEVTNVASVEEAALRAEIVAGLQEWATRIAVGDADPHESEMIFRLRGKDLERTPLMHALLDVAGGVGR